MRHQWSKRVQMDERSQWRGREQRDGEITGRNQVINKVIRSRLRDIEFRGGDESGSCLCLRVNKPVLLHWLRGGLYTSDSGMDLMVDSGLGTDMASARALSLGPCQKIFL